MTTKEQERKALEQIRKIVAGLGEDSYIGTAFEGCFEIAQENIENDFACSMKQRADSAQKEIEKLREQMNHMQGVREHVEGKLEASEQEAKKAHREAQEAWDKVRDYKKAADEALQDRATAISQIEVMEIEMKKQTEEIIHLKAKLYDMMAK